MPDLNKALFSSVEGKHAAEQMGLSKGIIERPVRFAKNNHQWHAKGRVIFLH